MRGRGIRFNPTTDSLFTVLDALGLSRMLMECVGIAEKWLSNAENAAILIVSIMHNDAEIEYKPSQSLNHFTSSSSFRRST